MSKIQETRKLISSLRANRVQYDLIVSQFEADEKKYKGYIEEKEKELSSIYQSLTAEDKDGIRLQSVADSEFLNEFSKSVPKVKISPPVVEKKPVVTSDTKNEVVTSNDKEEEKVE